MITPVNLCNPSVWSKIPDNNDIHIFKKILNYYDMECTFTFQISLTWQVRDNANKMTTLHKCNSYLAFKLRQKRKLQWNAQSILINNPSQSRLLDLHSPSIGLKGERVKWYHVRASQSMRYEACRHVVITPICMPGWELHNGIVSISTCKFGT